MSNTNAYQHIHLCKTEYEKEFPDDWIDKLDWSSISNAEKSFKFGQKKISELTSVGKIPLMSFFPNAFVFKVLSIKSPLSSNLLILL